MKKMLVGVLVLVLSVSAFSRSWWQDAVFYEVFVRSFFDSDSNGIGDLNGLTEKLDYLNDGVPGKGNDLGIDALWLMPIFASPSYHGYDTTDYKAINPAYGTMDDFESFLKEAHRRGIRVILDLVINHTGSGHPWFLKSVSAKKGYENYYVWKKKRPSGDWQRPWGGGDVSSVWNYHATRKAYYYAAFWGGMPDLNLTEPLVVKELHSIAKFWLDKGVDGFRLDAARFMIEEGPGKGQADTLSTLKFWKEFESYVRSVKPDVLLVGEVWTGDRTVSKYYQGGKGLDLCFDFEMADSMLRTARYGAAKDLQKKIKEKEQFPKVAGASSMPKADDQPAPRKFYAPFLSNHDQIRTMTVLNGKVQSAKIAAALLLVQPGTPFLYYGEEIGIQNVSVGGDRGKRTPMQWKEGVYNGFTSGKSVWALPASHDKNVTVEEESKHPDSLLSFYRKMIKIRHNNPEFRSSDISTLNTGNKKVIIIKRVASTGDISYLLVNGSKKIQKVVLPAEWIDVQFKNYLTGERLKFANSALTLPGKTMLLLKRL